MRALLILLLLGLAAFMLLLGLFSVRRVAVGEVHNVSTVANEFHSEMTPPSRVRAKIGVSWLALMVMVGMVAAGAMLVRGSRGRGTEVESPRSGALDRMFLDLDRMEERVGNLETILLDRHRK